MYFIIESQEQLGKLTPKESCFVNVVSTNDQTHPKLSRISLVYYNDFSKGYMLCVDHSESMSLEQSWVADFISKHGTVYLLDKKYHSYFLDTSNCVDLNFEIVNNKNELVDLNCNNSCRDRFYREYPLISDINRIIPISKQYEYCECLFEKVKNYVEVSSESEFEKRMVEAYSWIESFGMRVNTDCFNEVFNLEFPKHCVSNDTVYTYYNLYNLTQRPTNAFNGFNALSVPKEKEYRRCLLPKNDAFLEFDFDGYHLRIISDLVNYPIPEESFHTYLGRKYFSKEELSEEDYQESKKITFRQLYGGVENKYKHIDFFKNIDEYATRQYEKYKADRGYLLPTGRIIKPNKQITKYKLFNYVIQNLETKINVEKILQIKELLKDKKTSLVLIAYDSFLFDVCSEDGKETLANIKKILELGNMKVKYKYGRDYTLQNNLDIYR